MTIMNNAVDSPRRSGGPACLAIAAAAGALIDLAVAHRHFEKYWVFGVFLLVAGWLQAAWAVAVLRKPSRWLWWAGAVLEVGLAGVYVLTRTVGDVIGPTPQAVEPGGFSGGLCATLQALVSAGCLLALARPSPAPRRLRPTVTVSAAAALTAPLVSASLIAGGPEIALVTTTRVAAPATPSGLINVPTGTPAGPITMPTADMPMTFGMQMAGGPCTQTPTAAQQAATVRLVQQTWSADRKFQDLATARAAGYRPVGPGGAVVHYFNQDVYAGTIEHRTPLDPAAPPSLVYANTPAGAVLVAAMYVDAPGSTSPPAPGGCLTRWHVHTNLCFADGDFVALTPPACPPGSVNQVSPPMLHIWLVPVPGGPTAVDADDDAVVAAAEQVAHPRNGTA